MKEKKTSQSVAWPIASAIGAIAVGVLVLGGVIAIAVVRLTNRVQPESPTKSIESRPEVIDLLALINAQYDAISGTWICDGETMDVWKEGTACLRIPISPPAEYQLSLKVTRESGSNTFGLGLVTSKSQVVACLDAHEGARHTGLELLDRAYVGENEVRRPGGQLPIGKEVTVTAAVGGSAIRVHCDGEEVISWEGDLARLSLNPDIDPRLADSLFLVAVNSGFRIDSIELRPTGDLPANVEALSWLREIDASSDACCFDVGPGFNPGRDWTLSFETKIDTLDKEERQQIVFWGSERVSPGLVSVYLYERNLFASIHNIANGQLAHIQHPLHDSHVGRWLPVMFHYRASDKSTRLMVDGVCVSRGSTNIVPHARSRMPIIVGGGAYQDNQRYTGSVRRLRFGNYGDVQLMQRANISPTSTPNSKPPTSAHSPWVGMNFNAFINPRDSYACIGQRHQIPLNPAFDPAKSWQLSMQIRDAGTEPGAIFSWGDNRPGRDVIVLYAEPAQGRLQARIADTRQASEVVYLGCPVEWSAEPIMIELTYDAEAKAATLRVGDQQTSEPVTLTPAADRRMPIWLGGINNGDAHAFPCTIQYPDLMQLRE